jgi:branched-chain amino acid aminotransferase
LGLQSPYSAVEILEAIKTTIAANGSGSSYVRPILFGRTDYLCLAPKRQAASLAILATRFSFRLFSLKMKRPMALGVFEDLINPFSGAYASLKASGRYLINSIAKRHAALSGYDDAVLLDRRGDVTETTSGNIFILKANEVVTPPAGNIVEGITRNTVIAFLHDMGIPVRERQIPKSELLASDAVFVTGTAAGIVGARSVHLRKLDRKPAFLRELQRRYLRLLEAQDVDSDRCLKDV